MKKFWPLIIIIILLITGIVLFFYLNSPKEEIRQIYLKVNPLISFSFKIENNKATINSFKLENDKAREIFQNIDFTNMELLKAIELYGDKLKENKIEVTTIYIWTTWDNKDYFKSDKYKLDVKIINEKEFENIPNETLPKLIYNQKYYDIEDKHGYSITFKEKGVLEYHLDEDYVQDGCGECTETECIICDITDKMVSNSAKKHKYRIENNYVYIEAKKGEFYNGWHMSYEKCEIMFNRLKCDNYNAFHSNTPEYQYTRYYELKNSN